MRPFPETYISEALKILKYETLQSCVQKRRFCWHRLNVFQIAFMCSWLWGWPRQLPFLSSKVPWDHPMLAVDYGVSKTNTVWLYSSFAYIYFKYIYIYTLYIWMRHSYNLGKKTSEFLHRGSCRFRQAVHLAWSTTNTSETFGDPSHPQCDLHTWSHRKCISNHPMGSLLLKSLPSSCKALELNLASLRQKMDT